MKFQNFRTFITLAIILTIAISSRPLFASSTNFNNLDSIDDKLALQKALVQLFHNESSKSAIVKKYLGMTEQNDEEIRNISIDDILHESMISGNDF